MTRRPCDTLALVDAHFRGELPLDEERAMRAHWPTCAECRARYQKQRLLSELDPAAPKRAERLAAPLGLSEAKPRVAVRLLGGVTLAAAAAALVVHFGAKRDSRHEREFAARGSHPAPTSFHVLRGGPSGRSLVEDVVHANDEISFEVKAPEGRDHVLVFATDAQKNVFWYAPVWQNAVDSPVAVPIAPQSGSGFVELPGAVVHALQPGPLQFHVVFTTGAPTVRDVEAHLGRLSEIAPDELEERLSVEVVP